MNKVYIAAVAAVVAFCPKPLEASQNYEPKPVKQLHVFDPAPEGEEVPVKPKTLEGDAYACACACPCNDEVSEASAEVAALQSLDWSNLVGVARAISVEEAKQLAANDTTITYFFWTGAGELVLEKPDGTYDCLFHGQYTSESYGDAMFFSNELTLEDVARFGDLYICN